MATTQVSPDIPRPSFAKVTASIARDSSPSVPNMESTVPMSAVIADGSSYYDNKRPAATNTCSLGAIGSSLKELSLSSKDPNSSLDGRASQFPRPGLGFSKEGGSDGSQRCDSSSEMGTKAASLDGKSITSGATFALDEKESLRPDDSASVQAAIEDDDSLSVRGSLFAGSRMNSDIALRAKSVQPGDVTERRSAHIAMTISPPGLLTPPSANSERGPAPCPTIPINADGASDALNVIYRQAPDERLLDALASPKDRLFLLRLEKMVIDFVQDSKEPYMDLPPSNSFCRMLTHKLADYYHMTHSFEPMPQSVRIFRTPFCRVPVSLATMIPQQPIATVSDTPPPAIVPRRIMRRGQDGDGALSASASKPTSESGSEAKDGNRQTSTQKLTLEQREENYKQARERIFGNSEESNVAENAGETGMSRTSSMSASNRVGNTKRGKSGRQRRDDSDSFDSRNQYIGYWGPHQQTWVPQTQGTYIPSAPGQFNAQPPQHGYPGQPPATFAQPAAGYANMSMGQQAPATFPTYGVPQYPPQPPPPQQPQQPQFPPTGSPLPGYGTPVMATAAPQAWPQSGLDQVSFPPHAPPPASTPGSAPTGIPYAFGQLPVHVNPYDPKSQHPIPGSYNRNHSYSGNHNFNPKTQSFVPGKFGMPAVPPPQPPFTAPGSHHSSPRVGHVHLAYGAYPPVPAYGGGGSGGFVMARQGSSNSIHGYNGAVHAHSPRMHQPQRTGMPSVPPVPHSAPPPPQNHVHQIPLRHAPGRPLASAPQGPSQMYGHLPAYGNGATLPPKPAAGI